MVTKYHYTDRREPLTASQIGDWESCNGVATVHFIGEYPWRVGHFGGQRLFWHCWCRAGVVSAPEIEFCALLPVGDPNNTASAASCTYIGPRTNLSVHDAWSGSDLQDCHGRDDTWNWFQTRQLLACQNCESHSRGSENQYWGAGKPMEYLPCMVWYINI